MKELAGRLTAVDPDAGAAVRVIAYFDTLAEGRAGLEAMVRGAAVLAGCPARLVDAERRVHVRVEPDGRRRDSDLPPDPAWPSAALVPDGVPALWLERAGGGEPSVVDAVILERAAGALRLVLDRTRGRAPVSPADDPALVETVLDPTATEQARLHAARRLGLDPDDATTLARALAPLGGRPRILRVRREGRPSDGDTRDRRAGRPTADDMHGRRGAGPGDGGVLGRRDGGPGDGSPRDHRGGLLTEAEFPGARVGVGPPVPVLGLPGSWDAARTALRFTAEGTAQDPGERVVHADDLGGIALLAELIAPGAEPPPDVRDLERAAADAPWMLATLHSVATTASLRAAATGVNVHHSTLQDRLAHAEALLGWPVRTPQGRLRLHLALTMRHLARGG
ncbi:helix-turn-helix domain-containing protein [Streptomyces europaeiscabiei]|uniref:helix-turn-helix domain-containing protein n=1 Tax=Streptomyces europaeiscabiei TaxID=146819 RepID=UPI0029A41B5B|nr:helix-turn-helix domain-containing protein [Streptomyces europaeiscabiei]MDX3618271.1 helix-turn-helix domain-containing protein [Streptomyces europaeiscabiei]MDX3632075.1 helix-turn-helix domain-containing protein [Streptomyces europaeiscabiei]MDX3649831.1 helix-turn-helix domain-containing protein [Streptomyces europaeiscabiei]WUD36930.1 helix-turn-helix domain-containing protein [Streptomyces europaeiscabiei]